MVWNDGALAFDIVEIEDGKRLHSTELWSLTGAGLSLKRVRRTEKAGEQTLIYVRTKYLQTTGSSHRAESSSPR